MSTPAPSYGLITTLAELEQVTAKIIAGGRPFGFDIETGYDGPEREGAAKHPEENFVAGISFTDSLSWARYVPIRHDAGTNIEPAAAAPALWRLLRTGRGVPHNGDFEERTLARFFTEFLGGHQELGEEVRNGWLPGPGYFPVLSDTLLEAHAEGTHKQLGLKALTKETFGHEMMELRELFSLAAGVKLTDKQFKSSRFNSLDQHHPKVTAYACEDSLWALANHLKRWPQVKSSFIYQLEMAILPIVCAMEDEGLAFDWLTMEETAFRAREFAGRLQAEVSADLTAMLRESDPGAPAVMVNLASPKQLQDILFTRLGMPIKHRTDKGAPSTGKLAMKTLAKTYPVCQKIQNWKSLIRLAGTYLEKWGREYCYAPDGRAHPSYLQFGVPAGRFAALDPPAQQMPKKYFYQLAGGATFIHNFRDNIIAPPGYYGLGFDMAQQELRIIAGEAREEVMCQAFRDGIDVHRKTASLMLGKTLEEVSDDERGVGKTLGLALGYSLSPSGLADRLGIPREEGQQLFDTYFGIYPAIARWMAVTKAEAARNKFTVTRWSGRRVPIWHFDHPSEAMRAKAERESGNTPIQGAAADYMKLAMVRADRAIRKKGWQGLVRLCLNMHDALEWYVHESLSAAEVIAVLQPAVVFTLPAITQWPPMSAEWHIWRKLGSQRDIEVVDGGVRFKTKAAREPEPVNEDPDEEDGPALPAVSLSTLRSAEEHATRAAPEPGPALVARGPGSDGMAGGAGGDVVVLDERRTVVIHLPELPGREEFAELVDYIRSRPGNRAVKVQVLNSPVDIPMQGRYDITPASDAARIALLVPGASVTWDTADSRSLAAGLSL